MKKGNIIPKLIFFLLGMAIIQLGVVIFLLTNAGSDPFTVFTQGLSDALGVSTGSANMIILVTLVIGIFLIDRKRLQVGTFVLVLVIGPTIDFIMKTLQKFGLDTMLNDVNLFTKAIIVALSCIIIAIGFSFLVSTELGVAPNDLVPLIIRDKTNFQYRWIRICLDLTFLAIGYALDGVVGVGTIIAVLFTGPAIQFFMPPCEKIVHKFIGKTATK
ncbi:YczE/YyaS/YitT family protein [Clostridium sp. B9]|uniref:YczE/YyaS/YitT family protein n=1 Tax=Clostridium sp. B9 TaxID=3423224 RepID=UPI003D2F5173